eukprot:1389193-Amorphochlora_amoeboformis.AAC.1
MLLEKGTPGAEASAHTATDVDCPRVSQDSGRTLPVNSPKATASFTFPHAVNSDQVPKLKARSHSKLPAAMSLVQRKSSFCAKNLHKDTPEFDLLLNVGGTVIKTYRILLTVACPYFATLINDASGDDVDKLELLDGKNGSAKGAILANDASGDVAKLEILDFKEGKDSVRGKAGCVRVGHLGSMEIFMEKEEKIGEIVVTGRWI